MDEHILVIDFVVLFINKICKDIYIKVRVIIVSITFYNFNCIYFVVNFKDKQSKRPTRIGKY